MKKNSTKENQINTYDSGLLLDQTSEITINILEVASELAAMLVDEQMADEKPIYIEEFTEDGESTVVYSDKAQDLFNSAYDNWYNFLLNHKIDKNATV